ncbi:recombinase family protein [Actinoplanes sp. NEAU-A12]|uniref:Recombinase family protein n=1 Tax=Actinoplanes sandaracinus TaxID=3045177 RepID=A0ABT6WRD1_9ACTN|nr:recombinase family protein [Actinoplanes sandaracinus]MDI6102246.1 recombinase family protein [Actinoplanes sandaracinus]
MPKTKTAPQNTAVAYLRVSTEEQAESGAGIAAQRAAIEAEAARRGWVIVGWHTDAGASGKSMTKRPALADALEAVEGGEAATLVVAKLDRLSRSLVDFAALMERARGNGWNLVALDLGIDLSTPAGEFLASVMASAAQWERRIIGQRTREGLAAKKAAGVRLGRPASLPTEVRSRIVKAHREGANYSAIARSLNADRVPTAQGGKQWYPATVKAVVNSQEAESVGQ